MVTDYDNDDHYGSNNYYDYDVDNNDDYDYDNNNNNNNNNNDNDNNNHDIDNNNNDNNDDITTIYSWKNGISGNAWWKYLILVPTCPA